MKGVHTTIPSISLGRTQGREDSSLSENAGGSILRPEARKSLLLVPVEELVALLSGGNLHEARLEIEQLLPWRRRARSRCTSSRQASAHKLHWTQSETWNSRYALPSSGVAIDRLAQGVGGTEHDAHAAAGAFLGIDGDVAEGAREQHLVDGNGSSGSPMRLMASRMAMLRSASMVGILPAPFFTPSFSRSVCSCFCRCSCASLSFTTFSAADFATSLA